MSIVDIIKKTLPNASQAFYDRMAGLHSPRYMVMADIHHWIDLRSQINVTTGKVHSYRDIRKICAIEDKTVPSLGTLRNYLGEGGTERLEDAKFEWKAWFERFGDVTDLFNEELRDLTTTEEWEVFNLEYIAFMGWS